MIDLPSITIIGGRRYRVFVHRDIPRARTTIAIAPLGTTEVSFAVVTDEVIAVPGILEMAFENLRIAVERDELEDVDEVPELRPLIGSIEEQAKIDRLLERCLPKRQP